MNCEIHDWFATNDGGDFFVAGSDYPFSVLPPRSDTDAVLYCSKSLTLRRLVEELGDERRFAVIARGGLPSVEEAAWMQQFVGGRRLLFLGDADPVDLLIFAWLRRRLPIQHVGLSDQVLNQCGAHLDDTWTIKLDQQERNALPLVNDLLGDLSELLGPWCAGLLSSGRKIEVEAMLSCATCTPGEMEAALLGNS